jgi:hypothetical protein
MKLPPSFADIMLGFVIALCVTLPTAMHGF